MDCFDTFQTIPIQERIHFALNELYNLLKNVENNCKDAASWAFASTIEPYYRTIESIVNSNFEWIQTIVYPYLVPLIDIIRANLQYVEKIEKIMKERAYEILEKFLCTVIEKIGKLTDQVVQIARITLQATTNVAKKSKEVVCYCTDSVMQCVEWNTEHPISFIVAGGVIICIIYYFGGFPHILAFNDAYITPSIGNAYQSIQYGASRVYQLLPNKVKTGICNMVVKISEWFSSQFGVNQYFIKFANFASDAWVKIVTTITQNAAKITLVGEVAVGTAVVNPVAHKSVKLFNKRVVPAVRKASADGMKRLRDELPPLIDKIVKRGGGVSEMTQSLLGELVSKRTAVDSNANVHHPQPGAAVDTNTKFQDPQTDPSIELQNVVGIITNMAIDNNIDIVYEKVQRLLDDLKCPMTGKCSDNPVLVITSDGSRCYYDLESLRNDLQQPSESTNRLFNLPYDAALLKVDITCQLRIEVLQKFKSSLEKDRSDGSCSINILKNLINILNQIRQFDCEKTGVPTLDIVKIQRYNGTYLYYSRQWLIEWMKHDNRTPPWYLSKYGDPLPFKSIDDVKIDEDIRNFMEFLVALKELIGKLGDVSDVNVAEASDDDIEDVNP